MEEDFYVECNVCKQHLKNWTGSTPCCGSIAFLVEDGVASNKVSLFASVGGGLIEPSIINFGSHGDGDE